MYLRICVLMIQATAVGEVQLLLAYCAPPPVLCDTYHTSVHPHQRCARIFVLYFDLLFGFGVLPCVPAVL